MTDDLSKVIVHLAVSEMETMSRTSQGPGLFPQHRPPVARQVKSYGRLDSLEGSPASHPFTLPKQVQDVSLSGLYSPHLLLGMIILVSSG